MYLQVFLDFRPTAQERSFTVEEPCRSYFSPDCQLTVNTYALNRSFSQGKLSQLRENHNLLIPVQSTFHATSQASYTQRLRRDLRGHMSI